jgi:heme exporter protein D
MTHWAFVAAAYAVTVLGVAGLLLWAVASMRRGEAAEDELRRR